MGNLITLDVIRTMSPCEFEDYRECGNDLRGALIRAVGQELEVPEHWKLHYESWGELGGFFPVQLRFTPPQGKYHLCVCSPGAISHSWLVTVLSSSGEYHRRVSVHAPFDPERCNRLIKKAARLDAQGIPPDSMAINLSMSDIADYDAPEG